jgi:hypothetical protein
MFFLNSFDFSFFSIIFLLFIPSKFIHFIW